jgi:hypothetical protein
MTQNGIKTPTQVVESGLGAVDGDGVGSDGEAAPLRVGADHEEGARGAAGVDRLADIDVGVSQLLHQGDDQLRRVEGQREAVVLNVVLEDVALLRLAVLKVHHVVEGVVVGARISQLHHDAEGGVEEGVDGDVVGAHRGVGQRDEVAAIGHGTPHVVGGRRLAAVGRHVQVGVTGDGGHHDGHVEAGRVDAHRKV